MFIPPFVEHTSSQRYYARQAKTDPQDGAPYSELNSLPVSKSVKAEQSLKMSSRNSTGYDGSHDGDGQYQETNSNNQSRSYSARARGQGDTQLRRKESVPERSPLQKLESSLGDKSKEEKRARAEHAEERARVLAAEKRKSSQQEVAQGKKRYSFNEGYEKLDLATGPAVFVSRSRTSSREHGHDANLKGGAAAAAVESYRASKSPFQENTQYIYDHEPASGEAVLYLNGNSGGRRNVERTAEAQRQLLADRGGDPAEGDEEDDFLPRHEARAENVSGSTYVIPPQTTGGVRARKQVAFGNIEPQQMAAGNRAHPSRKRRYQAPRNLEEWREADTAILTKDYIEAGNDTRRQSKRQSITEGISAQTQFKPVLYLRCGPLLRYTGLRRGRLSARGTTAPEFWSGSVMIVTEDAYSSYERTPVLRVFKQQMRERSSESSSDNDGEHEDDFAGQVKMSRNGAILVVRPPNQLGAGLDLSHVESNQGLFERMVSADQTRRVSGRIDQNDGEKAGRFRDVKGFRLHRERGVTFWRFNIQIELTRQECRFAYRINHGPPTGFWVPAIGQTMNIMFHSDNGFDLRANTNNFCGPDPMWRDVLRKHQLQPFHVMIGGGDQIYNDAVMQQSALFQKWVATKNTSRKHGAEFTPEMQDDLEGYYLTKYSLWFSQGLFSMANAQIPMVNMWNDHDIIDGFGSYPHHFMSTPVFSGLGAVAFKYYMLFQHQSLVDESEQTEPSWLLGVSPGPYINQLSRSLFMSLGSNVSLLSIDCRTERMFDEILSQDSWDLIFDRCYTEIVKGLTRHLIVVLGVPISYPKSSDKQGILGELMNKFDRGSEPSNNDSNDYWTAEHHEHERNWFIQELQLLAAEKEVRVTILGGGVHLAAVGQFISNPKLGLAKDRDHRYMPNVVSSAMANAPQSEKHADALKKRNKLQHMDDETDEDMIPLFAHGVDNDERKNEIILPRRNWCSIRQYEPGLTPPPSPPPSEKSNEKPSLMSRARSFSRSRRGSSAGQDPDKRRVLRKFSNRRAPPTSYRKTDDDGSDDERQPRAPQRSDSFRRRPSRSSSRAVKKDPTGRDGYIDLHGGLEIAIHCEVDRNDPFGRTVPYRVIVPALFPNVDPPEKDDKPKRSGSLLGSFFRGRGKRRDSGQDDDGSHTSDDDQEPNAKNEDESEEKGEEKEKEQPRYQILTSSKILVQPTPVQQNVVYSKDIPNTPYSSPQAQVGPQASLTTLRSLPRSNRPLEIMMQRQSLDDKQGRGRSSSNDRFNTMMHNTTQGPPPPKNVDQLPASVQKRYSQYSEPGSDDGGLSRHTSNQESNQPRRQASDRGNNGYRPSGKDPPLGRVNNEFHNYIPEQALNYVPAQKKVPVIVAERRVISGPPTVVTTYRKPPNEQRPQPVHRITSDDDALPYHESRSLDVPQRAVSWNPAPPPKSAARGPAILTAAKVAVRPQPLQSSPTSYFPQQPQRQSQRGDEEEDNSSSGSDDDDDDNDDEDGSPQARSGQRSNAKIVKQFGPASGEDSGRFYTPSEGPQGQGERPQQEKKGRGVLGLFMRRMSSSGGKESKGKFKAGW